MAKWADYLISAVRYDSDHRHITNVMVHEDNGDTVGAGSVWTRQQVIASIKNGRTFYTVFRGTDGNWKQGQKVIIIKVNGVEYIKTTDNGKAADNLENLPEF